MEQFIVQNRASIWLSFIVLVIAATMMHPTFASLIAIGLIAVALAVLRWVAHVEGRADARNSHRG